MYSHKKMFENENCISRVWIRNKRLQTKLNIGYLLYGYPDGKVFKSAKTTEIKLLV